MEIYYTLYSFLTILYNKEDIHNSLSNAKSALQSVVKRGCNSISDHPLIKRFRTGIFNLQPPTPKHTYTWDTTSVRQYIKNLPQHSNLKCFQ